MNDLSNREKLVLDYIKTVLGAAFPKADLRNESEFMETFALPHVKLFEPMFRYIDRLKLMQSLENAALLTTDEMDEMTASYYNPRKSGLESDGIVVFVLSDLPDDNQLIIPAYSIETRSKSGLVFRNYTTVTFDTTNAPDYYDAAEFNYKIPIPFESVDVGVETNVDVYEINECIKGHPKNFAECYNDAPFINGRDTETNVAYAVRLQEEMFAPNLGVERGYKRFVSSFTDVRDSLIVGFKHPLMQRDVIGEKKLEDINLIEGASKLHWGTKVDIYLRGKTITEVVELLPILEDDNGLYIKVNYVPFIDVISMVKFSYSAEFDDPSFNEEELVITDYSVVRDEEFETFGTVEEETKIYLRHPTILPSQMVRITYVYNALIKDVHSRMYDTEERPPTADVKLKEAHQKTVYGAMVLKMWSATGLRDHNRSYIRNKVEGWIGEKMMGDDIKFSELLEPLSSTTELFSEGIIEYIHLPYQFIITDNNQRYLFYTLSEKKQNILTYFKNNIPALYAIFNRYKNLIATYDFFDFFHSTISDNRFDELKEEVGYIDFETGILMDVFTDVRGMVAKAQAIKSLSPATTQAGEHCYYQLGDIYLYEHYDYTVGDWQKMVETFVNLSYAGSAGQDKNDSYRLCLYFVVMMKILTEPSIVERPQELKTFVLYIVERTPIASEF